MEPKDLKNPEGLKSTQDTGNEKNGNAAASNEQDSKEKNVEKPEKKIQENRPKSSGLSDDKKEVKPEKKDEPQTPSETPESDDPEAAPGTTGTDKPDAETQEKPDEPEGKEPGTEETAAEKLTAETADADDEAKPEEKPETENDIVPDEVESETKPEQKEEETVADEQAAEKVSAEAETEAEPRQEKKAETESEEKPEPEKASEEKPDKENEKEKKEEPTAAAPKDKPHSEPEKKSKTVHRKKEKIDYSTYSQIELVNALRDVLDSNGDHDIKDEVETIRAEFYKQAKDEIEEQKKQFIADGGKEEDFQEEENPYEQDIKDLLKRYRQIRHEFNKKLEQEKELNLQVKYEIIEEIKGLINKEESINKTFQDFRDLQQRWREIGLVPQSKMKDLWNTYHFHVENFYDYIKINKELRDLDLKKNLEMKIRLCEQAEELLLETNTIKAFNELQKLHERWREIGPVPRENKDDIWERFKASTAKINKKHQKYFDNRKNEQKKNLEAKRALCEQVEEINETELTTHKEWSEKSKEVVKLQKIWRTIGFAPRKDNNKIYNRFRGACDKFFDAKREFYSKNKELQQNNLQMKIDLCMQAEAIKDNTDWRKTTQDFINIQKQWKEIGPVPRKHSEALWKRFRAACDYFFDKKAKHFSNIDSEQAENMKLKEQLIKDVETFKSTGDVEKNLNALKDFQRRWTEIGHVPIKNKDEIQKRFREAVNKLFDDLNIDESKRNLLKFRTKMASFSESSRGQNKMRFERDKYMSKLKQLESDLVLLDNNIGFFAKSKNAESLIEDVKGKIEQTKEKIEFLKNKIRVIDEMDQSEE